MAAYRIAITDRPHCDIYRPCEVPCCGVYVQVVVGVMMGLLPHRRPCLLFVSHHGITYNMTVCRSSRIKSLSRCWTPEPYEQEHTLLPLSPLSRPRLRLQAHSPPSLPLCLCSPQSRGSGGMAQLCIESGEQNTVCYHPPHIAGHTNFPAQYPPPQPGWTGWAP